MDPQEMATWPEMRYMPANTVQEWVQYKNEILTDSSYDPQSAERAIAVRRTLIAALHDASAGLLLGSDSPQIMNVPGFSIHRELQFLVDSGLSPYAALLTGTVNPAIFFGTSDVSGQVKVGYEASLVLLDANPLEDISATRRIHGVFVAGRWVSGEEIATLLRRLEQ
jgi:imidazolonepropionase-like amidohydrolase